MSSPASLDLDRIVYGIVFPAIMVIGFIGAVINLVVIHTNAHLLKSHHYVYVRGMTVCDLLVVMSSVPFAVRMASQRSEWDSKMIAWYYAHLELYLINIFCGTCVLLTVATTVERYLGFCHPFKARNLQLRHPNHSKFIVRLIPIVTAVLYLPFVFRSTIEVEISIDNRTNASHLSYDVVENYQVTMTIYYTIFNYAKEVIFRLIPAIALGLMNARIIHSYKRASRFLRRKMTMRMSVSDDEMSQLNRDRRLIIVLVGITLQFIVCTAPAAVLAMTFDANVNQYATYNYDVFRSVANLLEITKNSSSFFVYCLCSVEYRQHVKTCFTKCSAKQSGVSHISENEAPR